MSSFEAWWGPSAFEVRAQSIPTRLPLTHPSIQVGDVTSATKQNTDGPRPDQALLGGKALALGGHLAYVSCVSLTGSSPPQQQPMHSGQWVCWGRPHQAEDRELVSTHLSHFH